MEQVRVEPELFNQGETSIISFPFGQDPKFAIDKILAVERIIHNGPPFTLKLNPKFNSSIAYQPGEACELPFKVDAWNKECEDLILANIPSDVAKRMVLRVRYPLMVEIQDGVIYSPGQQAVCEALGKITTMRQQRIPTSQVFLSPPTPQVHRQVEAAREAVHSNFASTSTAGSLELLANMTQAKPLTRIPFCSAPEENGPTAGPCRPQIIVPPKKRALSQDGPANQQNIQPTSQPTHAEMLQATNLIQQFFGRRLMDLFKIPGDRLGKNIPDQQPQPSSLGYSFSQWQEKGGLRQTNTTKMSYYKFGEGKKNINMFLYKCKNRFTGHNVPFSIREGASILNIIVLTMVDALEEAAKIELESDKKAAGELYGQAKEDALQAAEATFTEKMNVLGRI